MRINYLYFELYLFVVPLFQIHKQIIITDLSQLKPSLVRSWPQTQGPYIVIHVFSERTLIPKMDATSPMSKNPEFRTRTKSSLRSPRSCDADTGKLQVCVSAPIRLANLWNDKNSNDFRYLSCWPTETDLNYKIEWFKVTLYIIK